MKLVLNFTPTCGPQFSPRTGRFIDSDTHFPWPLRPELVARIRIGDSGYIACLFHPQLFSPSDRKQLLGWMLAENAMVHTTAYDGIEFQVKPGEIIYLLRQADIPLGEAAVSGAPNLIHFPPDVESELNADALYISGQGTAHFLEFDRPRSMAVATNTDRVVNPEVYRAKAGRQWGWS